MGAFLRVSLRHLGAHRLRTILTVLGVAFGVAAIDLGAAPGTDLAAFE